MMMKIRLAMPPSNTITEITAGMIVLYIAVSIFAAILLSFLVRFFIKMYNAVKELVPDVEIVIVLHQQIMVS
jgi:hypothetical protein